MSIDILTTQRGPETSLNQLIVSGADNHVTIGAKWQKGGGNKRFRLTLNREDAMELCASMMAVLSDGRQERAVTRRGGCGDHMMRFPQFKVYTKEHRDKLIERNIGIDTTPLRMRKPTHFQRVETKPDPNGNSRKLVALYTIIGNIHSVITVDNGNTPEVCWGLMDLPPINVTPTEYKSYIKLGEQLQDA